MSTDNQNQQNKGGDFPGYPHYPTKEDITQPSNHTNKLNVTGDGDVKTTTTAKAITATKQKVFPSSLASVF